MLDHQMRNEWDGVLSEEFNQSYYLDLSRYLIEEYKHHTVYPRTDLVYEALRMTSYSSVKALILGQDPYHGAGQAHGLSFSVQPGVPLPPSLRNMMKERQDDLGLALPRDGHLAPWAKQGVLLLNTVLTVRAGEPGSHAKRGWERLTDAIIRKLNEREQPIVFILWGKHAQAKRSLIDGSRHPIIESAHPSPLSARHGFFGSRPFSRTNAYLRELGIEEIDWRLESEVGGHSIRSEERMNDSDGGS